MRSRLLLPGIIVLLCTVPGLLDARTWTSRDGKTIEADYVSATNNSVTIRRKSDRRIFVLSLLQLSTADRVYVQQRLAALKPGAPRPKPAAPTSAASYQDKFKGRWVAARHGALGYQVYAPKNGRSSRPLPVVVYLHGSLEAGSDNKKQIKTAPAKSFVKFFKKRPCILIVPQCGGQIGSWMGPAGDLVISLLDDFLAKTPEADKKRVYLTGYSLGAMGTRHLLGKRPDLFAAAIPAAGAGNPAIASRLKDVDVWIFHGAKDASVPVARGREMAAALKQAGAPVKFTEWKSVDHSIPGKVFFREDVHEWLFAQRKK